MYRVFLSVLVVLIGPTFVACTAGPRPFEPDGATWVSTLERAHPLAGRIWQPAAVRFVESDALVDALAGARYAIIGESHDNPDHHRIQTWLVEQLFERGRSPAVAFEMFTTDQEEALDAYLAAHPRDASGLGEAVDWNKRGWPAWSQYQPIAQAALDAGASILAADLARETNRMVAKEGFSALGAGTVQVLGLDQPMPPESVALMRREIIDSHCDQLPESMIDPMTTVMMARDAHMAGALLRGAALPGRDGAVLITGKGHGRTDHAVPYHLRRLAPGDPSRHLAVSVAMVEVAADETEPSAYADRFIAERLPFDYVWFTPYPDREAPCERFADQLRKAKERHLKERKPE